MQTFKVVESYLHRAAKGVLLEWLREAAAEAGQGNWFNLAPVSARPNRGGPHYGIWEEYPILKNGHGAFQLWDEHSIDCMNDGAVSETPPTVAQVIDCNLPLGCVIDIAVTHKGRIAYALEVVHRHPTPFWKRAFLSNYDITLIEVSAAGIMHQIGRPSSIPLYTQPTRARAKAWA